MKRLNVLFLPALMAVMCLALFGQGPQGGGRGGGRGGGGRGGGRGGAVAPATGPVADMTNMIVEAINKQDAMFFDGKLTADAILADEDGHFIPAMVWVQRLTSSPKKLTIEGLRVGDLGADAAWAGFTYTLDETARGAENQMTGTTTIVYKKNGANLQIAMVHLAVKGAAITPH